MRIQGSTVLITGATGGIGQAVARTLAGRGASVVLTGRRTDVLEPLAAETRGRAIACDLSDAAAVRRLMDEAGPIDILVANAALPASGPLFEFEMDQIDRALDVNLRAPIVLTRVLGEQMAARGSGHLVYVSSLAGKTAPRASSLYSATKFGLRGFALSLREDLRESGVGVSTIFPGFIRDAGMFADSGAELPAYVGTSTAQEVADGVVKAIERNRAEVDVAPLSMRAGVTLGSLAPELSARVQRRLGSRDLAEAMSEGQRSKR